MIFLFLPLFIWVVHRVSLLLAKGLSHYILNLFLLSVGIIIPTGYLLSEFNQIGSSLAWGITTTVFGLLILFGVSRKFKMPGFSPASTFLNGVQSLRKEISNLSLFWRAGLMLLLLAFVITTLINIVVLFVAFPNEWDSMTGHLVKCAYYLQYGNMDRLQGTTWTIDFYPNSLPTLQIFGYHLIGEKGFKLIHYFSYWIFVVSTYAIASEITRNRLGSFVAALLAALLPSALIQAVTTETDIVQSAYLGIVVYYLLVLRNRSDYATILLAVLAISIWISHKVTFMLIGPSVAVVGIYSLIINKGLRKKLPISASALLFGLVIYVAPNGYIANVKEVGKFKLGALSAPEEVMNWHGIEHYSTSEKIKNLELNILRYSSDFLHLDGIRNTRIGEKVNDGFRYIPNQLFARFNLERDQFWVVGSFQMMGSKKMKFYAERPFWGVISFGLVLPVIVWIGISLFSKSKRKDFELPALFILAAVLHFLSLSYSAPYDPIKGRYFMNMAVWCLPLLAFITDWRKIGVYFLICSSIISVTAILTLTHRMLYPLSGEKSIFKADRISQLTISRQDVTDAYQKFEELVPEDARVAISCLQEHEDYVYPLWGKEFKRYIITLRPFRTETLKPIPEGTDYLFYTEGTVPFQEGDIVLGKGDTTPDTTIPESTFYLRKL
jgi:hypothetical protein